MERETNLKLALVVCFFAALQGICAVSKAEIIYVDDSAIGANDGTSWEDAYIYLQDALADANSADKPVEIRVAQGIYTPDLGGGNTPDDRNATFQLINGVTIQGGYAGLDFWNPNARETSIFETILSGVLNDDVDPNFWSVFDYFRTVVTGSNTDETAVIDGFIIEGGSGFGSDGAGIHIESGSPTIMNCLFISIDSIGSGPHISHDILFSCHDGSSPTIISCTFEGNTTSDATEDWSSRLVDGVMENRQSSPVLIDCIFRNNRHGMENRDSSLVLTNCIFQNHSNTAIEQNDGSLKLEGCSFIDNSCGSSIGIRSAGGISNSGGDLIITDCIFTGNSSDFSFGLSRFSGGGAISNSDGCLILTDCIFTGNSSKGNGGAIYSRTGDIFESGGIVSISSCDFINNSADDEGGAVFASDLTLRNCRFIGNSALEGGALHISASDVHNCIFEGNLANQGSAISINPSVYRSLYNCTFYGNRGSGSVVFNNSRMYNLNLTGCIIRNNDLNTIEGDNVNVTYCNIEGGCYGEGNIDIDPGFINPGYWDMNSTPDDLNDDFWVEGDYHLKSQAGRWANLDQTWIQDDVTSPCIDAGDPNSPIGFEPFPNGSVYNMGAYGRSMEASKTYFGEPVCDVILAGDINGDCVVDFDDISIVVSQWALSGGDFINCPPTVTLITPQNGDQITWPGPTTFQAEADDIDGEVISVMFRLEYKDENISQGSGFSDSNGSDGWEREYTWRDSARYGNWTAWVEATDNEGAVGISEKITITLNSP